MSKAKWKLRMSDVRDSEPSSLPKCQASVTYKVVGNTSKFTNLIWDLTMEEIRYSVSAKYKVLFLCGTPNQAHLTSEPDGVQEVNY